MGDDRTDDPNRELYQQRKALVNELLASLGDDVPKKSLSWWHYFVVGIELGPETARQLVEQARAVEAQGGMSTRDGSRKRTLGGIFFALARGHLGPRKWRMLRVRAQQRYERTAARLAGLTPDQPAGEVREHEAQPELPKRPAPPSEEPTTRAPSSGPVKKDAPSPTRTSSAATKPRSRASTRAPR